MRDKVLAVIAEYGMIQPGDTVIAALSGGADSMCLLSLLQGLQKTLDFQLIAAHMNHQLRGMAADQDEAFVEEWCQTHNILLHTIKRNVAKLAALQGIGTEECGRNERYSFFQALAAQYPAAKIATAHTLSDQQETVLLNLTRGTGSRGLCGIPPIRQNIIRPLIACTRDEIEEYCRQNAIPYVIDATNSDPAYARNRIRHHVVPELCKINPGFSESVWRMTRHLTEQEEYLTQCSGDVLEQAQTDIGYSTVVLTKEPPVIRIRCCRIAAERNGAQNLAECHLQALDHLLFCGGCCALPGKLTADVFHDSLRFYQSSAEQTPEVAISVCPPENCFFFHKKFSFSVMDGKSFFENWKVYKKLVSNAVNYDTISGSIVLRNRRPGDVFSPSGRGLTKKVKKLFNEQNIPPEQREQTALLESNGRICWIEGIGVSEQAKISQDTRQILIIVEETE